MELRGRVALVTGAGRRLGRELARALAGRGMTLAIHHHASSEGAESLRAEVIAGGGRATNGIYLLRMEAGRFMATRKMVVAR